MSLIPKIGIGTNLRKNKFHIPAITHGTSEIGYVVPSYSRNLINNASVSLSTRIRRNNVTYFRRTMCNGWNMKLIFT